MIPIYREIVAVNFCSGWRVVSGENCCFYRSTFGLFTISKLHTPKLVGEDSNLSLCYTQPTFGRLLLSAVLQRPKFGRVGTG